MVNEIYKTKATALIKKAKEKGLVKKYKDFSKTDISKESKLTDEEIAYYISNNKEEAK